MLNTVTVCCIKPNHNKERMMNVPKEDMFSDILITVLVLVCILGWLLKTGMESLHEMLIGKDETGPDNWPTD